MMLLAVSSGIVVPNRRVVVNRPKERNIGT